MLKPGGLLAAGIYGDVEEASSQVGVREKTEPDPGSHELYEKLYSQTRARRIA